MKKIFIIVTVLMLFLGLFSACGGEDESITDADSVVAAKTALTITYASGDSASSVTDNVTLATSGTEGTSVSWASDTVGVVAVNGTVTCPVYGSGDASVIITATITKGAESDTKVFTLTVKEMAQTDAEAVVAAKTALTITYASGDSASSITDDVTLATSGTEGTSVSWASDTEGVIAVNGTVARPANGSGDASVTLTATITKGTESDTKVFTVTVSQLSTTLTSLSAVSATASASTQESSHVAADAIDSSGLTRWANSSTSAYPAWVAVDLGTLYSFNYATFSFESYPSGGFYLQSSKDGSTWSDIGTLRIGESNCSFTAVEGRYFRIYAPDGLGSEWFSIYEMTLNHQ